MISAIDAKSIADKVNKDVFEQWKSKYLPGVESGIKDSCHLGLMSYTFYVGKEHKPATNLICDFLRKLGFSIRFLGLYCGMITVEVYW